MATRAGRRRKLSLHEETSAPVSPLHTTISVVAMTTRKRDPHRHKENQAEEKAGLGQFVKYLHDTPIGKNISSSVIEAKPTRTLTKRALKENHVNFVEEQNIEKHEKVESKKPKVFRITRSNKTACVDVPDGDLPSMLVETFQGTYNVSPKMGKKKKNKKKVIENITYCENDSNIAITQGRHHSVDRFEAEEKPKRSKKICRDSKNANLGAHDAMHTETLQSNSDTMKTAGSTLAKSSLDTNETFSTPKNISVDSFHSAAGSSPLPSLELVASLQLPSTHRSSDESSAPLDATFDKNSHNSTITLSTSEVLLSNEDFLGNQSSANLVSGIRQSRSGGKNPNKESAGNLMKKNFGNSSITVRVADQLCPKSSINGDVDSVLNTTFDKSPQQQGIIKENGNVSEDIFNTTLVLVDSITDCSRSPPISPKQSDVILLPNDNSVSTTTLKRRKSSMVPMPIEVAAAIIEANKEDSIQTPPTLIREGTFTKEGPEVLKETVSPSKAIPSCEGSTESVTTPTRARRSLPAPGSTPYHARSKNARSIERSTSVMNVTRSIEKDQSGLGRLSCVGTAARQTRVMFCSPVWNAERDTECKSKIIKSSLKGSNKSFVYEEHSPPQQSTSRKRSYTQGDAENVQAKRKKLAAAELTSSVNRLSRPKNQPTAAKPLPCAPATPSKSKPLTPRKSRSEGKPVSVRSKLPDFAALHRRQFDKMESLTECQERKAQRARQMLQFPPTGLYTLDGRRSPRDTATPVQTNPEKPKETKSVPLVKTNTYTRFGFKLQTDINPFSIPSTKTAQPNRLIKDKANATVAPRVNGTMLQAKINATIPSLRREKSKQMITREKSSTAVVEKRKKENRDIIKGVRTNRRFELQMKSRNIVS